MDLCANALYILTIYEACLPQFSRVAIVTVRSYTFPRALELH